jgi:5-bromo-4-chloroindolyl phosphate hydrolysis protein
MQAKAHFLFPLLFFILVITSVVFIAMMFYLGVHAVVIFAATVALAEFVSSILWYYKNKEKDQ